MGRINPYRHPIRSYRTRFSCILSMAAIYISRLQYQPGLCRFHHPFSAAGRSRLEIPGSTLRIPPLEMKLFDIIDFISYIFYRKQWERLFPWCKGVLSLGSCLPIRWAMTYTAGANPKSAQLNQLKCTAKKFCPCCIHFAL